MTSTVVHAFPLQDFLQQDFLPQDFQQPDFRLAAGASKPRASFSALRGGQLSVRFLIEVRSSWGFR